MRLILLAAVLLPAACAVPALSKKPPSTGKGQVQKWMSSMSLREKVAQLLVLPFYGDNPAVRSKDYRDFRRSVRDLRVGGLIIVNRVQNGSVHSAEPYAMAAFLNRMQKLAKIPLLVAGDFERGASMRMSDTVKFPHAMAFAAARNPGAARQLGAFTAVESRAMGVQWLLAPDADVNNNPDNPIINIRSYGEDPATVAEYVTAFIDGAHSDPKHRVLVTAKHFPGHGDTATDSHLGLPRLDAGRARLDQVEFVPFRAAIAAGADSIMSAHIAVPALDSTEVPITVSNSALTNVLRKEMNFRGLIVTDAMDMQGLTKEYRPGEAAVRALEAGSDVLLMPPDPEDVIRAILAAVREHRLSRRRIDESVARILAAKVRLGLNRKRLVDLEAISDEIASPEAEALAQDVADRALTLVKNERNTVPLAPGASTCFLILTEGRYSREGITMIEELKKRAPKAAILSLDPAVPDPAADQAIQKAATCGNAVVAAFVSVAAYRGNVTLAGNYPRLLDGLLTSRIPVTLVALGNPYLLRAFPGVAAYLAAFSTVPDSESAVVRALFGEIPIHGRLPVTIPGIAPLGSGFDIRAK